MSTIIVWANNMLTTGHGWPGHAAVNIGAFTPPAAGIQNYVSWWPGGGEDLADQGKKKAGAELADPEPNIVADIALETYLPDYIIRLNETWGQRNAMQARWNEIRGKQRGHYKFLRKNCSTITARILRAGGFTAGAIAGLWYDHSSIWTPLKVKDFALQAGGRWMSWTDLLEELNEVNITPADLVAASGSRRGQPVTQARDQRFCRCGAPCRF
jgi:hypothetical protein